MKKKPAPTTPARASLARAAQRAQNAIPPLEWIAAGIGVVLVAGTIAFVGWRGVLNEGAPPQIDFKVRSVHAQDRGYLVEVRAINRGGRTASDVEVEGELAGPQGTLETATLTFKYLPPQSERTGGLYFVRDPRKLELTLRAKGYEAP